MSKFKSDKMIDGRPERERIEDYCGRFVESNNRMQAYRLAYSPDVNASRQWIWDQVRALHNDPEVQRRIQEMRDEASVGDIVTFKAIIQDLVEIATADVNELISMEIDCCRHCNGINFAYQWIDEMEFINALATHAESEAKRENDAIKRNGVFEPKPVPSDEGGYGYHPRNDTNYHCPHCFGRGIPSPVVRDTTKLTPQARKLYAGVKVGKDGQIEVKMHDQMKARQMLGQLMGYFKDGSLLSQPTTGQSAGSGAKSEVEDPQQAYLKLIG